MTKCSKCGKEFEGNYCPYCGTKANLTNELCPVCGHKRAPDQRYCSSCGYDFNSAEKKSAENAKAITKKFKKIPKFVWIIVAVVIVVIVAVIVYVVIMGNKFRLGVVEKIELGDSKAEVINILGEPYKYNSSSSLFEYYSDNYLKLLEENDSFDPDDLQDWGDLEDAFNDALELEQKLQTEEYKYIAVNFDSDERVTSVLFDASRTEQTKSDKKTVKNYKILNDILLNSESYDIEYTVYYTDGSYYLSSSSAKISVNEDTLSLNWSDIYGNEFTYDFESDSYYDEISRTLYIFSDSYSDEIPADVQCVIIGDAVTSIGDYAFSGCTSLKSIAIPDSVTSIGSRAFYGCDSLTSIAIPDSVTSIGRGAFEACTSLTSIAIPDSVTYIGDVAFYNCFSLTSITIPDSVTSIGGWVFMYCPSLTSVTIGNGVTSIGGWAFAYCTSLESITIPDRVTEIGNYAFENCVSLTSVIIPDSVTSIGNYVFYNCSSLTSIAIPDSVTSIGRSAFEGCDSLTSVIFENTEGWSTVITNISSSELADPETAAKYLTGKYSGYDWKRS